MRKFYREERKEVKEVPGNLEIKFLLFVQEFSLTTESLGHGVLISFLCVSGSLCGSNGFPLRLMPEVYYFIPNISPGINIGVDFL